MDSYLLTVKYIFHKSKIENLDQNLNEFFTNGSSFPKFIAVLYGIDQIPGIVNSQNKFQISNNNRKALTYLGQKNPFFSSYSVDFNNEKNQISLIQLILNKVYFKINRASFLPKCNEFLQSFGLNITNFSEFLQGTGFMKLMNAISKGSIPLDIKFSNNNQLVEILTNHIKSLDIPVIIDNTSFMPMNQDILIYQALIIIDYNQNVSTQNFINQKTDSTLSSSKSLDNSLELNNSKNIEESKQDSSQNFNNQISLNETKNSSSNISLSNNILQSSEILDLPKFSFMNVVNNILELHNMKGIKYVSDFEKGEVLPTIIEILLNEKIPKIVENPSGYDQIMNNMNALFFINQKDQSFSPRDYNMSVENDVKSLIRVLLQKYIFTNDYVNNMKNECNRILQKYNIMVNNFNTDWDNGINFVALLNFLSNGGVIFPPPSDLNINLLKSMFVKADCIPIIEDDAIFGNSDEFMILYQVKLILDDLKSKKIEIPQNINSSKPEIPQINQTLEKTETTESSKAAKTESTQNNSTTSKEEAKQGKQATITTETASNNKIQFKIETKEQAQNEVKTQERQEKMKKSYPYPYTYVKDSCPILRMMNVIGANINLHYNKLDDIINGLTLHQLVKYLMGISEIPGIKESKAFEQMNINSVLNFLRNKNNVFKYTSFDFNDPKKKKENIIWFGNILLKQFYLKETKAKMIQKAGEITGEKIFLRNMKEAFSFGNYFYKLLGDKDMKRKNFYDEQSLLSHFENAKVPFILDSDSLTNINEDYICFQLQLIFDYSILELANIQQQDNKTDIQKEKEKEDNISINNSLSSTDFFNFKEDALLSSNKSKTTSMNSETKESALDKNKKETKIADENPVQNKNQHNENNPKDAPPLQKTSELHKPEANTTETNKLDQNNPKSNKSEQKIPESSKPEANTTETNKMDQNNPESNKSEQKKQDQIIAQTQNKSSDNTKDQNTIRKSQKISKPFNLLQKERNPSQFKEKVDKKVLDLFRKMKEAISSLPEEQDEKPLGEEKSIEVYRLLEYKSNKWIFNEDSIINIKNNHRMLYTDIIHFILLFPCCTIDKNAQNDQAYRLISAISGCKTISGSINDDVYVEIGFCGNIEDIRNRFNIKCINRKKEILAFVQLRYPPSFKDNVIIENMQAALILQASYVVSAYPKTTIDDLVHFMNTSMFQASQSSLFDNHHFLMSQLLTYLPDGFDKSDIILTHNSNCLSQLEYFLNNDKDLFNDLKNCCSRLNVNIQWINDGDAKSYITFVENLINYCQMNFQIKNQFNNTNDFLKNLVKSDLTSINYIDDISNIISNYNKSQTKSLFTFVPNNIKPTMNFNSKVLTEFLTQNNINRSMLSLIFFSYSDPKDVHMISKIFSELNMYDDIIVPSDEFHIHIIYCGSFEYLSDSYQIDGFTKNKNEKNDIAFIYIENFSIDKKNMGMDDILLIESMIAQKCDIIITIGNKKIVKDQLCYLQKMENLTSMLYELDNDRYLNVKKLFLIYGSSLNINDSKIDHKTIENLPSSIKKLELNLTNTESCSLFLTEIYSTTTKNNKKTFFTSQNTDISSQFIFYVKIFQDFPDILKKTSDSNNELNIFYNETINRVLDFFVKQKNIPYSMMNIERHFLPLMANFRNNKDTISALMKIKNNFVDKFIYNIAGDFIEDIASINILESAKLISIKGFFQKATYFVEKDLVDFLESHFEEITKDLIYEQAGQYCMDTNKSNDLKFPISNMIYDLFEKKNLFKQSSSDLENCYKEHFEYKKGNAKLNEKEISQDSMKYVLAVRESIKEMTVEITCDEDLEKEIPQDF